MRLFEAGLYISFKKTAHEFFKHAQYNLAESAGTLFRSNVKWHSMQNVLPIQVCVCMIRQAFGSEPNSTKSLFYVWCTTYSSESSQKNITRNDEISSYLKFLITVVL